MTSRIQRHRLGITALAAAASLMAGSGLGPTDAQAAVIIPTITSTFTQSNIESSTTPQDWGTLNFYCSSGTCTVNLVPTANNTFFDTNAIDLDLNLGQVSNLTSLLTLGTVSTGSFNNDGFGTFDVQYNIFDGPNDGISTSTNFLSFNYTGSTSTLLVLNSKNFDASGHVFNPTLGTNGCTFKVGEGTGTNGGTLGNCTAVPEPNSLALLGTALVGLGFLGFVANRRRSV